MTAIPRERNDAKVLGLSALGGALEFYDFVVFVFFTKTLGQLFFPSDIPAWLAQLQVYGIFAAGYLVRPLGGVVMAHFGDRLGRKRMFSLSIFLMALPTLLIGLLPTYAQIGALAPVLLLALRMLQGLAIGGEMPGAWVFVAEHAPPARVGFAVGSLSAGINVGTLMGSLMASWVVHAFAPAEVLAWGWRIAFVVGGVFGFVSVWLRRWLDETPVFARIRAQQALSAELPIKRVLKGHAGGVAVSMLATWALTAGILIGSLLAAWINTRYSAAEVQAWVWRVPFLIGGVFGFVAVRLRRWLEETPVFVEMRERRQLARQVPVKQVLAAHRPAVVLSILASWQLTAAIVVIVLLTPTLVQTSFGIAPAVAFHGNSLATLALVFGCLAAGWAVDRIGVGRALSSGSLGLGVAAYALYGALLAGHEAQFVAWYTLAGFCCGVVGVTPALMVAAFPPEVRFSGLSFSYNVAYAVFGALTPPLLAWLAEAWGPLAPAHYVAFTCVIGAGVAAWIIAKRPLRY